MANAAGFIQEAIWRDTHWRQLSRSAQALYMQLLSQKELDCAGILPLQPNKWAKGCDELTVEQVWEDLDELQQELFVFFDIDTDETFIRTYMRNSNVIKSPNMIKSALRAALLVGSEMIKPLLATELRATGRDDAAQVANQIDPSGTPPEPFRNPSGTVSEPPGVGVGVGTGVTSGVNHLGERRPECSKHEQNSDTSCRACMKRREWDERHESDELDAKRTEREARRKAIDDCRICDPCGMAPGRGGLRHCDHQQEIAT